MNPSVGNSALLAVNRLIAVYGKTPLHGSDWAVLYNRPMSEYVFLHAES